MVKHKHLKFLCQYETNPEINKTLLKINLVALNQYCVSTITVKVTFLHQKLQKRSLITVFHVPNTHTNKEDSLLFKN